MLPTLAELITSLEALAPLELAEDWDNVGLLAQGSPLDTPVQRVLSAIDLTEPVLEEALASQRQLLVIYHPPIFGGLKRLCWDEPQQRILVRALQAGMSIWSPHTALDAVEGGVNDWLLGTLGAMQSAAPLRPADPSRPQAGAGRRGELETPLPLSELVARVKSGLELPQLRLAASEAHAAGQLLSSVGVCPGAGGSLFSASLEVDLLVTGEMSHHQVLDHVRRGRSVILTEHSQCERGYLPKLMADLQQRHPALDCACSRRDRDPLSVV